MTVYLPLTASAAPAPVLTLEDRHLINCTAHLSMVVTRAAQRRGQEEHNHHSKIAHYAAEQERQLQADRAMIEAYRKAWQEDKGIVSAIYRHVRDVLWWLMHVCGVNMLDHGERVIVSFLIIAVLALIILGAYKQGTQLVVLLQQLAASSLQ